MKPGRNEPCACGSGRKYKHCCLAKSAADSSSPAELAWRRMRQAIDGLVPRMLRFFSDEYGVHARYEAMDEFLLWDEDFDELHDEPALDPVFLPWMLHSWSPDPIDTDVTNERLHGVTPTQAFLNKYARTLDPVVQRYLAACQVAPFAFYEILEVDRGHHFRARELMCGAEYLVMERSATQAMEQGQILFGLLPQVDGIVMLEACPMLPFGPMQKLELIELRKQIAASNDLFSTELLKDCEGELRGSFLDLTLQILYPPKPKLCNTDGDVLSPQRLIFDIDSPQEAFDALKHLALDAADDSLLDDAQRGVDGALQRVEFSWLKSGNKLHKHWDNTSLGNIVIDGGRLTVEVNSDERAAHCKRLVEQAMGKRARYRVTELESLQHALAEYEQEAAPAMEQDDLQNLPEVQGALRDMMSRHYADWVHQKLPALQGKTPLEAVDQVDGREMVEALVAQIELSGRRMTPPLDITITQQLREQLGLRIDVP